MKVRDVVKILKADILVEGDLDLEVRTACGSDMMSDVLAFVKDQSVLLTGLTNPQVVRTAEMMDMHCIIFVRGKEIDATRVGKREGDHRAENPLPYVYRMRAALYQWPVRGK